MTWDKHIAVLVCDTPIEYLLGKYGDFGDNVIDLLRRAGQTEYPFIKYQVKDDDEVRLDTTYRRMREALAGDKIKGVVLTGSRSDSFAPGINWIDQLDNFITKNLFEKSDLPIVGICFGHQILAKNLGSKVGRNKKGLGWEAGTTSIIWNRDVLSDEASPFHSILPENIGDLNLVEFHQDIVYSLPTPYKNSEFISIGNTPKCDIQGLLTVKGPVKVLTFQGHPEFTTEIALEMLENDLKKKLPEDAYWNFAQNTKRKENQGLTMGKVINVFISKA